MNFYLGTHEQSWLRRCNVPLFISRRRLERLKNLQPAGCRWALDSGGFTELFLHGEWSITPHEYILNIRRYISEIGNLDWAAQMDWMCEPFMIKKTGLSVREHQKRTVENFIELKNLAPDLPIIPVLQGFEYDDYIRHIEDFQRAGINLCEYVPVGLGSVCRRQHLKGVAILIQRLSSEFGLKLHGFGFKTAGIQICSEYLISCDSLAWSFVARKSDPLPGCKHKSCANCLKYALKWRENLLNKCRYTQYALAV